MATKSQASISPVKVDADARQRLFNYVTRCKQLAYQQWNIRNTMMYADKQYARENDYTEEQIKAKNANFNGDARKFQDVTVPIVQNVVETAVTYQSSVFLTGTPLFGVVSTPEHMNAARQLETIIDYQSIKGGWVEQFILFFLNAFKYNIAAIEVDWSREMLPFVQNDPTITAVNGAKTDMYAWEGNTVKALDMYNTFWDVRYKPNEISKRGEFAGYIELCSRTEIKKFLNTTPNIIVQQIRPALESATIAINIGMDTALLSYFIPQISQSQTVDPTILGTFNWLAWGGLEQGNGKVIDYKDIYQKTTIYGRLIPADFGIQTVAENTPQIWKIIFINDQPVYAQPVVTYADMLPILFASPKTDGLGYQTKSFASDVSDYQNVATALMNSVIAGRRRAVTDRVLYDPSRISEKQINNPNPSAKIPVRPAAYGKNIAEAVYQFPYRDDQAQISLQEIQTVMDFADRSSNQNRAKQGQFVKGNKTRREFDSVMANANGRDQRTAMLFEAQLFTPLKEHLKFNILRNQTPATLYSRQLKDFVSVDPVQLRKASLAFKVSDGLIPAEKLIDGDTLGDALNALATNPSIGASYQLGPMFSYLMKIKGADLEEFEKSPQQVAYEQAMQSWQGTVQMIVEAAVKRGQDLNALKYPPQPKPADYGYTPGTMNAADEKTEETPILAQYINTENKEKADGQTASQ